MMYFKNYWYVEIIFHQNFGKVMWFGRKYSHMFIQTNFLKWHWMSVAFDSRLVRRIEQNIISEGFRLRYVLFHAAGAGDNEASWKKYVFRKKTWYSSSVSESLLNAWYNTREESRPLASFTYASVASKSRNDAWTWPMLFADASNKRAGAYLSSPEYSIRKKWAFCAIL